MTILAETMVQPSPLQNVIDRSMTVFRWILKKCHWPVNDNLGWDHGGTCTFTKCHWPVNDNFSLYKEWVIAENCHWPVNDTTILDFHVGNAEVTANCLAAKPLGCWSWSWQACSLALQTCCCCCRGAAGAQCVNIGWCSPILSLVYFSPKTHCFQL